MAGSLGDEVVEEELAREREEHLLRGLLVDRVLRVAVHRSLVVELHHEAQVEGGIHQLTLARARLAHAQSPNLRDLAQELVSCVDQSLSIRLVAGLLEPDETDVVKPAQRRGIRRGASGRNGSGEKQAYREEMDLHGREAMSAEG